jgi:serine/threonine protein kinase
MRTYVGISHPSIVTVHDFFLSTDSGPGTCCLSKFISIHQSDIVMDYCDSGDLERKIKIRSQKKKPFENSEIHFHFLQTVQGMSYIHSKHLIHRDLKPGNLFCKIYFLIIFKVQNDDIIKIGDLGLAKNIENSTETHVGTIAYMSPEQRSQLPYSYSADVWALGMILFELITLQRIDYGKLIQKKNYLDSMFEDLKNDYDPSFFDIVKRCLTINPEQRPTTNGLSEALTGFSEGSKVSLLSSQVSFMKTPNTSKPSPFVKKVDELIPNVELEENIEEIQEMNEILSWTVEEVSEWLSKIGMKMYQETFTENEINGEALLELKDTDEFYKYLGIKKLGHIKILQKRIHELNNQ